MLSGADESRGSAGARVPWWEGSTLAGQSRNSRANCLATETHPHQNNARSSKQTGVAWLPDTGSQSLSPPHQHDEVAVFKSLYVSEHHAAVVRDSESPLWMTRLVRVGAHSSATHTPSLAPSGRGPKPHTSKSVTFLNSATPISLPDAHHTYERVPRQHATPGSLGITPRAGQPAPPSSENCTG